MFTKINGIFLYLSLVVSLSLFATISAHSAPTEENRTVSSYHNVPAPKIIRQLELGSGAGRSNILEASDGTLYTASRQGRVFAINHYGAEVVVELHDLVQGPIVMSHDERFLFVSTADTIYTINIARGLIAWRYEAASNIQTDMIMDSEERIYFAENWRLKGLGTTGEQIGSIVYDISLGSQTTDAIDRELVFTGYDSILATANGLVTWNKEIFLSGNGFSRTLDYDEFFLKKYEAKTGTFPSPDTPLLPRFSDAFDPYPDHITGGQTMIDRKGTMVLVSGLPRNRIFFYPASIRNGDFIRPVMHFNEGELLNLYLKNDLLFVSTNPGKFSVFRYRAGCAEALWTYESTADGPDINIYIEPYIDQDGDVHIIDAAGRYVEIEGEFDAVRGFEITSEVEDLSTQRLRRCTMEYRSDIALSNTLSQTNPLPEAPTYLGPEGQSGVAYNPMVDQPPEDDVTPPDEPVFYRPAVKARYTLDRNIGSSVAVVNDLAFVGSRNGSLYRIDDDGAEIIFTADDAIGSTPAIGHDERTLYFTDYIGGLYSLDGLTGELNWRRQMGIPSMPAPPSRVSVALDNEGNVYAVNDAGQLVAYSMAGDPLFSSSHVNLVDELGNPDPIGGAPTISPDNKLYFGTASGKLFQMELSDYSYNLLTEDPTGKVASASLDFFGNVYFTSNENQIGRYNRPDSVQYNPADTTLELNPREGDSPVMSAQAEVAVSANGRVIFADGSNIWIDFQNGDIGTTTSYELGDHTVVAAPAITDTGNAVVATVPNNFEDHGRIIYLNGTGVLWTYEQRGPSSNVEHFYTSPTVDQYGDVHVVSSFGEYIRLARNVGEVSGSPWSGVGGSERHRRSYPDFDRDSCPDGLDQFDLNPTECLDNDGDGIGDNEDIDDDNDYLPDEWEIANNLNPRGTVPDTDLDPDNDGLTNEQEYDYQTNPVDSANPDGDSDGDEFLDAWELLYQHQIPPDQVRYEVGNNDEEIEVLARLGDYDSDGLINWDEHLAGTSPYVADTDGDGIDDRTEVRSGPNPLPLPFDCSNYDPEGSLDLIRYGTDPLRDDRDEDLDCDGYTNGEEAALGTDPTQNTFDDRVSTENDSYLQLLLAEQFDTSFDIETMRKMFMHPGRDTNGDGIEDRSYIFVYSQQDGSAHGGLWSFGVDLNTGEIEFISKLVINRTYFGAMEMSPDGRHFYLFPRKAGHTLNNILPIQYFEFNANTEQMTRVGQIDGPRKHENGATVGEINGGHVVSDFGFSIKTDSLFSPDGSHLYVPTSGESGVLHYSRNAVTGELSFEDHVVEDPFHTKVAHLINNEDGTLVYMLQGGVLGVYEREAGTGRLIALSDVTVDPSVTTVTMDLLDLSLGVVAGHVFLRCVACNNGAHNYLYSYDAQDREITPIPLNVAASAGHKVLINNESRGYLHLGLDTLIWIEDLTEVGNGHYELFNTLGMYTSNWYSQSQYVVQPFSMVSSPNGQFVYVIDTRQNGDHGIAVFRTDFRGEGRPDNDGDGIENNVDDYPERAEFSRDFDGDGIPDDFNENCDQACRDNSGYTLETLDDDDDGDGYKEIVGPDDPVDIRDYFPNNPYAWKDTDLDGMPDFVEPGCDFLCIYESGLVIDLDDDNDGYRDYILPGDPSSGDFDLFISDESDWFDSDGDGFGNNHDSDDDNDGMLDVEEIVHGLNPFDSSDGLSDATEIEAYVAACLAITDIALRTEEAFDPDRDCLVNNAELARGSMPFLADSDGDGTLDYADEVPLNANETGDLDGDGIGDDEDEDADGDGLRDEWEDCVEGMEELCWESETGVRFDPLVNNNLDLPEIDPSTRAFSNPDNDELSNAIESQIGTNPFSDDTDGDGLPDGYEYGLMQLGEDVDGLPTDCRDSEGRLTRYVAVQAFDPTVSDFDADGLLGDYDYDCDGYSNYQEYQLGTDPLVNTFDDRFTLDEERDRISAIANGDVISLPGEEEVLLDGLTLNQASRLFVHPSGRFVFIYKISENVNEYDDGAIFIFDRADDGALRYRSTFTTDRVTVGPGAWSPDGNHFYVFDKETNAFGSSSSFKRYRFDETSGQFTVVNDNMTIPMEPTGTIFTVDDFAASPSGFDGEADITFSPNGRLMFVPTARESGVLVFARNIDAEDPNMGELTFVHHIIEPSTATKPARIIVSDDGSMVYVIQAVSEGDNDNYLRAFEIDYDALALQELSLLDDTGGFGEIIRDIDPGLHAGELIVSCGACNAEGRGAVLLVEHDRVEGRISITQDLDASMRVDSLLRNGQRGLMQLGLHSYFWGSDALDLEERYRFHGEIAMYRGSGINADLVSPLLFGMATSPDGEHLYVLDNRGNSTHGIVAFNSDYRGEVPDSDGDRVADEVDAFPEDRAFSQDHDNDGLPDEYNSLLICDETCRASASFGAAQIDQDDDNDGFWDEFETLYGSDLVLNTPAFVEIKERTELSPSATRYLKRYNPLSLVNDGQTPEPVDGFGNSQSVDSDGDGLLDIEEMYLGTHPFTAHSDAVVIGSDIGDGIPDGWEVVLGHDPLARDGGDDPDGDGYSNYREYQLGTNPFVNTFDDANVDSLSSFSAGQTTASGLVIPDLANASRVIAHPNGQYLFVLVNNDVLRFEINGSDGQLSYLDSFVIEAGDSRALTISPDGSQIYVFVHLDGVGASRSIYYLDDSGALLSAETVAIPLRGLEPSAAEASDGYGGDVDAEISADGEYLYVPSGRLGVKIYVRNISTGELTFESYFSNGLSTDYSVPRAFTLSQDPLSRTVYLVDGNRILRLARDADTGHLSYVDSVNGVEDFVDVHQGLAADQWFAQTPQTLEVLVDQESVDEEGEISRSYLSTDFYSFDAEGLLETNPYLTGLAYWIQEGEIKTYAPEENRLVEFAGNTSVPLSISSIQVAPIDSSVEPTGAYLYILTAPNGALDEHILVYAAGIKGIGHNDRDEDETEDRFDAFPDDPSEQDDSDLDGCGDNSDEFPDEPSECLDSDNDGIGDNADTDDDNDGLSDVWEQSYEGFDPLTANPEGGDYDGDGLSDLDEQACGTDPTSIDTDGDGRNATLGTDPSTWADDALECNNSDYDPLLDDVAPVVQLGTSVISHEVGSDYEDNVAVYAYDFAFGEVVDLSDDVDRSFAEVEWDVLGTHPINYSVRDANDNRGAAVANITIVDTQAPVISVYRSQFSVEQYSAFSLPNPQIEDEGSINNVAYLYHFESDSAFLDDGYVVLDESPDATNNHKVYICQVEVGLANPTAADCLPPNYAGSVSGQPAAIFDDSFLFETDGRAYVEVSVEPFVPPSISLRGYIGQGRAQVSKLNNDNFGYGCESDGYSVRERSNGTEELTEYECHNPTTNDTRALESVLDLEAFVPSEEQPTPPTFSRLDPGVFVSNGGILANNRYRTTGTVQWDRLGHYEVTYSWLMSEVYAHPNFAYRLPSDVMESLGAEIRISRIVSVSDNIAPVIPEPPVEKILVESGTRVEDISFPEIVAFDEFEQRNIVPSILDTYRIDTSRINEEYTVRYHAEDLSGNVSEQFLVVGVAESEAPLIRVLGGEYLLWPQGVSYIDPGVEVIDQVDGDISSDPTLVGIIHHEDISFFINANDDCVYTYNSGDVPDFANGALSDASGSTIVDASAPGQYGFMYVARDRDGNFAEPRCRIVEIRDILAPTIELIGDSTVYLDVGAGDYLLEGVTVTDQVDGNDPALLASLTMSIENLNTGATTDISHLSFGDVVGGIDTTAPGQYRIVYGATDQAGNSQTESRFIVVQLADNEAPVLTLEDARIYQIGGLNYIDHELQTAYSPILVTALDAVHGDVTSQIIKTGEVDPNTTGTYPISFVAADLKLPTPNISVCENVPGNVCFVTVNVADTIQPELVLQGSLEIEVEQGYDYAEPGYSAIDGVDGDVSSSVVVTTVLDELAIENDCTAGVPLPGIDTLALGTYKVCYSVTDAAGNEATAVRNVVVSNTEPPVITLLGAASITVEQNTQFTDPGAVAFDAQDGPIDPANIVVTGTVNVSIAGEYELVYSVTDSDGNTEMITRMVEVEDTIPPVIILDGIGLSPSHRYVTPAGPEVFDEPGFSATDLADGDLFNQTVVVRNPLDGQTLGHFEWTYDVTDLAGNVAATQIRYVEVVNTPPEAEDDTATLDEDVITIIDVLENDTDANGDELTVVSASSANGEVEILSDGTLSFTPELNYFGPGEISYQIADVHGSNDSAIVTLDIRPVNDAPVAVDDVASTNEDQTSAPIVVLDNDTDVENDSLTVESATANNGSVIVNADGTLSYTPDADFNGVTSLSYAVIDGNGGSDVGQVQVTVVAVNDAPVAANDAFSLEEDTVVESFDAVANDSDIDTGDVLVVTSATAVEGSVTVNPDNTLRYVPAIDYHGADTINYSISDGNGGSASAVINVTVTEVNDNPVAVDDVAETDEDTEIASIDVLANDSDIDGDSLTVSTASAANGSVTINVDSTLRYLPNEDFNGVDTLSYSISDGRGGSASAVVTISVAQVNDAPVAANDLADTDEDTVIESIDVMANDSDPEGDSISVVFSSATNGTVTENADGTLRFVPTLNFNGAATISYRISDGALESNMASVTVTVRAVNDAPQALNDSASTDEDTTLSNIDVLANDTDIDGDALSIIAATANFGSVAIDGGTSLSYTPNQDFNGADQIQYTVSDGNGGEASAIVDMTVLPVNDAPIAVDDVADTNEDETIPAIDVLANDSDPENSPLTIDSVSATNGAVSINGDQTLRFVPDADFFGSATISYVVSDGERLSAPATVLITVNSVNDNPIAVDDVDTTNEDTLRAGIDVLANDTDIENDPLTVVTAVSTEGAQITINAGGSLDYLPAADFSGTDVVTYTINDGQGGSDTGTLTMTVVAVNDVPVAVNDAASTDEDEVITSIDVLANDTDADGDDLSVVAASISATNGTVTINPDGTLRYVPNGHYFGSDVITYAVFDGTDTSPSAQVAVSIASVNDAPVAADDSATTREDVEIPSINLIANDTDIEGDNLSITSAVSSAGATVEILAGGSVRYIPAVNFNGIDTVNYVVSDGNGGSDTANLVVTVTADNDAPVAANDAESMLEDAVLSSIDVVANDSDVDGDPMVISQYSVDQGTVTLNPDNTLRYVPDANFNGTATISYRVSDGSVESNQASAIITVTPQNDAPVAANDAAGILEDETLSAFDVLTNDSDIDGDDLTVTSAVSAQGASVTINPDGTITYTPPLNYAGTDIVTYSISDGNGGADSATLTIAITDTNDTPIARNDSTSIPEDSILSAFDVLANDEDGDDDPLSVSISSVDVGTVTASVNADNSIRVIPPANYFGVVNVIYTITDGFNDPQAATLTVTVVSENDAPVVLDDSYTVSRNRTLEMNSLPGSSASLVANDSDIEGDTLSISRVNGASFVVSTTVAGSNGGSFTINSDGTATFVASGFDGLNPGETATTTVSYVVTDGTDESGSATVTITVTAPDVRALDDSVSTNEDSTVNFDVFANDVSTEGAPAVSLVGGSAANVGSSAPGSNGGSFVINANGAAVFLPNSEFEALNDGENATTSISYELIDPEGNTSTATVTVTVSGISDDEDSINVSEDDGLAALGNFIETAGSTITAVNGSGANVGTNIPGSAGGTWFVQSNGDISFDLNDEFNSLSAGSTVVESIDYTVTTLTGVVFSKTLTVNILGQNDSPTAVSETLELSYSSMFRIFFLYHPTYFSPLGNDSDPDGDELFISHVNGVPLTAGVYVAGSNGGQFFISYNPTLSPSQLFGNFNRLADFDDLQSGESRATSIQYTLSDGNGGESTATFTVNVTR